MHAGINVRIDLDAETDKTLPLAVLGEIVAEKGYSVPAKRKTGDHHTVSVTLAERDAEGTLLLDVSVNDTWEETATALDKIDAIADQAAVVSDAEENLVEAFVVEIKYNTTR